MGAAPFSSTVFESFTDRSKERSGDLPKEGDKDDDCTAQSFSMVIKSHNDMRLLADIPPSEGRPILGRLVEDVYDADPFPLSVLQVFPLPQDLVRAYKRMTGCSTVHPSPSPTVYPPLGTPTVHLSGRTMTATRPYPDPVYRGRLPVPNYYEPSPNRTVSGLSVPGETTRRTRYRTRYRTDTVSGLSVPGETT